MFYLLLMITYIDRLLLVLGVGSGFLDASSTSVLAVISSSNALTTIYACFSIGSVGISFLTCFLRFNF